MQYTQFYKSQRLSLLHTRSNYLLHSSLSLVSLFFSSSPKWTWLLWLTSLLLHRRRVRKKKDSRPLKNKTHTTATVATISIKKKKEYISQFILFKHNCDSRLSLYANGEIPEDFAFRVSQNSSRMALDSPSAVPYFLMMIQQRWPNGLLEHLGCLVTCFQPFRSDYTRHTPNIQSVLTHHTANVFRNDRAVEQKKVGHALMEWTRVGVYKRKYFLWGKKKRDAHAPSASNDFGSARNR